MVVPVDTPQTVELLRQKGLRCVCELCDCGRPHKHRGCLKQPKEPATRSGLLDAKTDYQATYTPKNCSFAARHLRKPLPRMRNPHPPPMDFRTINRTEIVPVSLAERQGPIKKEDSYEPSSEKLDGKTVYMQDYENRGPPDVVHVTRPKTMLAPQAKFYSNTTHNDTFTAKKPIFQAAYGEVPSFVGSIIFPEAQQPTKTVNQDTYKGKFVPRVEAMKPKEAQITLGRQGSYDHQTMHRQMFQKLEAGERAPRFKRGTTLKIEKRAKFEGQTQHKSDFPGVRGSPARPAQPPPSTLQIAYSNDRAMNTTNKDEYKITWDPSKIRMAKSMKKDDDEYHPPTEKFCTQTQSMADFQAKSVDRVAQVRPISQYNAPKIKFRDETSYGKHFPKHSIQPRVRYGEVPVHSVHLKPIEKFHQDGSTTTQDFKSPENFQRRSPFKPSYTMHVEEGKMDGDTVYRSEFVPKKAEMCKFEQWLVEHEARHKAEIAKSEQVVLPGRKAEGVVMN